MVPRTESALLNAQYTNFDKNMQSHNSYISLTLGEQSCSERILLKSGWQVQLLSYGLNNTGNLKTYRLLIMRIVIDGPHYPHSDICEAGKIWIYYLLVLISNFAYSLIHNVKCTQLNVTAVVTERAVCYFSASSMKIGT